MYFILAKIQRALNNEKGAGAVEVAVIIVILVALAIIFRNEIEGILEIIVGKITEKVNTV